MKSHNNLWNKFISFKNLYSAFLKAKKSKPKSKEIIDFKYNLESELFKIQDQLITKKYACSDYFMFKIFEPKERLIKALPFKDRVVQHALCNIIEPIFDKTFISNSYACRKNKGTHAALKDIRKDVQLYFNLNGHSLKSDVRKYFPSIDHIVLKKIISNKIRDKQMLWIINLIIDSDHSDFGINKGIPIGNLTSQLFADIYLNELDKFVKHKLKAKFYYRYVDDFIIFSNSKKVLHTYKRKIKYFLHKYLCLDIPNKKTNIYLIKDGVDFVGYKVFITHTRLRRTNILKFVRRTKRLIKYFKKHNISITQLESSISSFLGYIKHADTYFLGKRIFSERFSDYSYLWLKQV